jgi:hypothetical protein
MNEIILDDIEKDEYESGSNTGDPSGPKTN